MPTINWGALTKSQTDSETIEQAIARIVAAHNADETAHLGTGQSLQSHKAADIIDHLAYSIVRDKLSFDRFTIDTVFETIDIWGVVGHFVLQGINAATLYTASSLNFESYASLSGLDNQQEQGAYSQNPNFQVRVFFNDIDHVISYIGPINEPGVSGFGFKQVDNKLYSYYSDDAESEQLHELATLVRYSNLVLRCMYDPVTYTHYYFINSVQVYSVVCEHTFDIDTYAMFYIKTTNTEAKEIWFGNLHYDAIMSDV